MGSVISIHSLRMEGDCDRMNADNMAIDFNPLPPHGGRRALKEVEQDPYFISIHSLRMEGDSGDE